MGTTFRPYSPDQELFLPPSLNEWLPDGHLAYFVSDVVEELDLSALYARYEGNGRRNSPFDPRTSRKIGSSARISGVMSYLRSCSTDRYDWTRSALPRRSWKRIRKRGIQLKVGTRTMIAAHPAVAGTSSQITPCQAVLSGRATVMNLPITVLIA